jgi:Xaa-Pro aminopeptidase
LIDKKLHENYVHKRKTPFDSLPMDYNRLLAQFCPHDIGHYLGLDVHDAPEVSKMLRLEPGCVITIEPGIYIRADNKNVPERYRGIGIRIEDDVAITDTGCEVLSKSIPKTITDIENLLKR